MSPTQSYACPNCGALLTPDSIESVEESTGTQTIQERAVRCTSCHEPFWITALIHVHFELTPYAKPKAA